MVTLPLLVGPEGCSVFHPPLPSSVTQQHLCVCLCAHRAPVHSKGALVGVSAPSLWLWSVVGQPPHQLCVKVLSPLLPLTQCHQPWQAFSSARVSDLRGSRAQPMLQATRTGHPPLPTLCPAGACCPDDSGSPFSRGLHPQLCQDCYRRWASSILFCWPSVPLAASPAGLGSLLCPCGALPPVWAQCRVGAALASGLTWVCHRSSSWRFVFW